MQHTSSIQTQYYDESDIPNPSNFYHHSTQGISYKKQMSPSSSGVALQIEQNIREYQEHIKRNKQTINQLQCQRKFFEKLSQKQKDKIQTIDLNQIRTEYEDRIFQVKHQVAQLHEVITLLQEEQHHAEQSYLDTYTKIAGNKDFLMETLINMEKQNQSLANMVFDSQIQLKNLQKEIADNEKTIKEKQAVHRKYIELQIEIQRLEKIYKISPKKRT